MTSPLKLYVISKRVMAANAGAALEMDKDTPVDQVYLFDANTPTPPQLTDTIGFNTVGEID